MINRIVRLSFAEGNVNTFLQIFEESKILIASFPGCLELSLMQDADNKLVFYTYSKWTSAADLEQYRNSILFKQTWARTKILFNDKPVAFSTELL
ncbi:MAG: antibiotic biosynthesis monooxygenase, partial [Bacteroidetes bacterium]